VAVDGNETDAEMRGLARFSQDAIGDRAGIIDLNSS
jgi:hypothetical protein